MRVTDLAELKQADPSTVSRQAAQLVKAGLARREADPADGRASRLAVTPSGVAACEQLRSARHACSARPSADWPTDRVDRLRPTFSKSSTTQSRRCCAPTRPHHTTGERVSNPAPPPHRPRPAGRRRAPGSSAHRQILTILGGLMMGMFLAALDQTIMATATRTIADDLQGFDLQAWATTAFLITSTISTPLYGKLSDIYGRRPFFLFAIAVFIVGSIALWPGPEHVAAGRVPGRPGSRRRWPDVAGAGHHR